MKPMRCCGKILLICAIILSVGSGASGQKTWEGVADSLLAELPKYKKDDSAKLELVFQIARVKMGGAQSNGKWQEAIEWWKKTQALAKKVGNEWVVGHSGIRLGQCFRQTAEYAEACKYLYAAKKLALTNGNKTLLAASSGNLGHCYIHLGNYEEALRQYQQTYNTLVELKGNGPLSLSQAAGLISYAYLKLKDYDNALQWARKAVPPADEPSYEGSTDLQFADIYLAMGNDSLALVHLRKAITLFPVRFNRWKREMATSGVRGDWLREYGTTYYKIGELSSGTERLNAYREAVRQLSQSVELIENNADGMDQKLDGYNMLKKASEALQDWEKALRYSNLYTELREQLYDKDANMKAADLKVQFETEKAAMQMEAEREKERLAEAAFRNKLLADERLQQEQLRTQQQVRHANEMAEEKLEQERSLAEANRKHDQQLAAEKAKDEKLRTEKERLNNLLLASIIIVFITALFTILLLRQKQLRRRAVERANALHKMAELELQSLRSQLNPHFMFNSLNAIQELILMQENDKSHSYLARFAKLLRMLLENAEKPFIPLQRELDFLHLYLGLESLRVPDLQYAITVGEFLNTEKVLIPNMILQPYIENAIWHGLSHKASDKVLQVRVFQQDGSMIYQVEDNGVGRKKSAELRSAFRPEHHSKGMELLSKRFKLLSHEYTSEISTMITDVIKNNEVAGTLVTIRIPLVFNQQQQRSYDQNHYN